MALDLERDRLAVAEVDDAGVLARALEHARRRGREALEEQRRVLVAAVLRPEQREDGELEVVRVAPEQLADTVELPVGEAEGAVERLFRDLRQVISLAGHWMRRAVSSGLVAGHGREPPPRDDPIGEIRACRSQIRADSVTRKR